MPLLRVVEWVENSSDEIVHKIDMRNNVINRGSKLTVREGQVAIFCDKGRMADVFTPGMYKLTTDSLPIITRLLSWAYGFETPYKSDVYFVSTKQFVNCKWGTASPVIVRDRDYGTVRVRAYGTYSFRVKDAYKFMQELSATNSTFAASDISDYLRSMLVMGVSEAVGASDVSVPDMAANLSGLGAVVEKSLKQRFLNLGLELCAFNFESFSLPEELEKALDENAKLGILRQNADVYAKIGQIEAMKEAAKNTGGAGGAFGVGIGAGFGMQAGKNIIDGAQASAGGKTCAKCGAAVGDTAKFCPECGAAVNTVCPKCGKPLSPAAKFCPECGEKLI